MALIELRTSIDCGSLFGLFPDMDHQNCQRIVTNDSGVMFVFGNHRFDRSEIIIIICFCKMPKFINKFMNSSKCIPYIFLSELFACNHREFSSTICSSMILQQELRGVI